MSKLLKILDILIQKMWMVLVQGVINILRIRRKPRVIQLPITGKCNSRCVTCNVWKEKNARDIESEDLKHVLADPFFSNVMGVGINGGELSLHKDFAGVMKAVLTLPKLSSISVISNGLLTNRFLERMKEAQTLCAEKGVSLSITLSIDGVKNIHDVVRGVPGAYDKTMSTLNLILENPGVYCSNIGLGCTISKYNVEYLPLIEQIEKERSIHVEYHLAVPNKRINTFTDSDRYSVLSDRRAAMLATEFFYKKMEERGQSFYDMLRYYMQYDYLIHSGKRRLANCLYRYQDVTIDESLNLYLCATASDRIGNLKEISATELWKNGSFRPIENSTFVHCDTCVHYCWQPTFRALFSFLCYKVNKVTRIPKFKLLTLWK